MAASPQFPGLPSGWTENTDFIQKGKIFFRLWTSQGLGSSPKNRILYVTHGQGEQSARYLHLPFYLQDSFDAIAIIDLPGHGQSKGIRGHIENFDRYSEAVLAGLQHFQQQIQKSTGREFETHWLGHSLGGLICLRTLLKKHDLKLQSVCVSAPLLGLAMKVPRLKAFVSVLLEPLIGRVPLANELDTTGLSHDKNVQMAYGNDPLNHSKVTPRFFIHMMREMELLKTPGSEFAYNLMMLVPLADPIVSWKAEYQFFDRLKMKAGLKKELQSFPNFKHEPFNELEKGRAFHAVETWIQKITKK